MKALGWKSLSAAIAFLSMSPFVSAREIDQSQESESGYIGPLVSGERVAQAFVPEADSIGAVSLKMGGKPDLPEGAEVAVGIYSNLKQDEPLTRGKIKYPRSDGWIEIELEPVELQPGKTYYIVIQTPERGGANAGVIWAHAPNVYPKGSVWLQREGAWAQINQDLCFRTHPSERQPKD